ncbi:hypothetical protein [Micromonospora sp. NPDC007230]|uniref:hypothetical protein n=1 Tax=Micromonospora sp. NPDC007230 TaxID=3364237 RepID=UPI00369BB93D
MTATADPDPIDYATAWTTLRARRYRCGECRRPTRNVTRDADGVPRVTCPPPPSDPEAPLVTYTPPAPDVARLIAEEVLRRRAEFRANTGHLFGLFRREIPNSPAAESPAAAATYVRWARADLGALGIAVRRYKPTPDLRRREWVFRLVAIPGEASRESPRTSRP